jgi:hypothetical protein
MKEFVNYDEAIASVRAMADRQREQFVMRLVTIATVRVSQGARPSCPLDMKFVVDCASALYDQRAVLVGIFEGKDERWWPDE